MCQRRNLNKNTYSVSIALSAIINMDEVAITITILTLAAVQTLGISFDFLTAVLLSVVATICASRASGIARDHCCLFHLSVVYLVFRMKLPC
ncbi:MAG TPA: cation:dicarboxylate symporter family transporter [Arsenophonus sp.]